MSELCLGMIPGAKGLLCLRNLLQMGHLSFSTVEDRLEIKIEST
jgi:hypothetical protein